MGRLLSEVVVWRESKRRWFAVQQDLEGSRAGQASVWPERPMLRRFADGESRERGVVGRWRHPIVLIGRGESLNRDGGGHFYEAVHRLDDVRLD